jgi:hypothetical protein
MRMRSTILLCLLMAATFMSFSQQSQSPARLTIKTTPSGAEVLLNNRFVGRTPLVLTFEPGVIVLSLASPSVRDWNSVRKSDTLVVLPGQDFLYEKDLGETYSINSIPWGASVFRGAQQLGTTPLFWKGTLSEGEIVSLKKQGFDEVHFPLHQTYSLVRLSPVPALQTPLSGEVLSQEAIHGNSNFRSIYVSAATMIVSGVIAAYFKDRANKEFALYEQTGSVRHHDMTRRFDRQAGISLAITQISFGTLAYFLLLE